MRDPSSPARSQSWDPDRYARNAGYVPALGEPTLELLAPEAGERVLDLGCGDGVLTEKIAISGAVVVGIDTSAEQVAAARARGLDVHVADATRLAFDSEFDAVFSNAALHWMQPPDAVVAGVWRGLRPGGRFVAETGGKGNVETVIGALLAALDRRGLDGMTSFPWYFPDEDDCVRLLGDAGFRVLNMDLMSRPTPVPGGLLGWLETFAESFLSLVPRAERPDFVAEVCESLAPRLKDGEGCWFVDYVRLRFAAVKPNNA